MRKNLAGHAFDWGGSIAVLALIIALTWRCRVPIGVPIDVVIVAGGLLWDLRARRLAAVRAAQEQARRADVLAGGPDRDRPSVYSATHYSTSGEAAQHVGDAERDVVLARIGDRFTSGHLTQGEFDERSTEAVAARTRVQLAQSLRDLP